MMNLEYNLCRVCWPNPLPLAGRVREGGVQQKPKWGLPMAPSPNPSHEGRGTPPALLAMEAHI
jgi:hypothetical protein